jgi:hypothetical protein
MALTAGARLDPYEILAPLGAGGMGQSGGKVVGVKNTLWLIASVALCSVAWGQRCGSVNATFSGNWKPASTAPRDGTIIEVMETYGGAPTYARQKWIKKGTKITTTVRTWSDDGKTEPITYTESQGRWQDVDEPNNSGYADDECLFWRPIKQTGKTYVDPTGGAQKSVAYWCSSMHRPYDAKTDTCK